MKKISVITIVLFSLLILTPVVCMNTKPEQMSKIDNRMLAENPFKEENRDEGERIPAAVDRYLSDRIGFRDDMILSYTLLNDKAFDKMVHPIYFYGEDGYIYGSIDNIQYSKYHEKFADMVAEIQRYCNERGIPFLFVFDPSKSSVLCDHLPKGVNYNTDWVDSLMSALDERGVNYINNTQMLKDKTAAGEMVYNQKFDANHWNDLGAFYGVNEIFKALQKDVPQIQTSKKEEFDISSHIENSLLVSEFPIHEEVPDFDIKQKIKDDSGKYADELEMDPNYKNFAFYKNPAKISAGVPRVMSFQGSYLNHIGTEFMQNGLGEYVLVHNYQNVLDCPYYFNLFQPECVIFEVAEYTLTDMYFSEDKMTDFHLNPLLSNREKELSVKEEDISTVGKPKVKKGKSFTKITCDLKEDCDYAWMVLGNQEYDMKKVEDKQGIYEITVLNEDFQNQYKIVTEKNKELKQYSF